MKTSVKRPAAAALDDRITTAKADVIALDYTLQLAHGTGDYRSIRAAQDSWQLAFNQLGRLIRQRQARAAR
jgi:hypothetical protein